jgi:hypothetical protein
MQGEAMHGRLLLLHQNLIYPAFLGALLVGFAQLLLGIEVSRLIEIDWLWLLLGLWFILYFCAAYLVLLESHRDTFGFWAFTANLIEVLVILFASITITQADPFGLKGVKPGYPPTGWPTNDIEFWKIFASWLVIPLTAAVANWFSNRWTKTLLSLVVMAIAAVGLYVSSQGTPSRSFIAMLTAAMVAMLMLYFLMLGRRQRWILDVHRANGIWTFAKRRAAILAARLAAATDAAGRAQHAANTAAAAATVAADAAAAARGAANDARVAADIAEQAAAAERAAGEPAPD